MNIINKSYFGFVKSSCSLAIATSVTAITTSIIIVVAALVVAVI